ncbi:unnamed protein product, partial [Didymodactylos carnosus]
SASFHKAADDEAGGFATDHIIMTMGSHFQHENSNECFKNLDKLTLCQSTVNTSDVSVFYSTPSCYSYVLNKAGHTWRSKMDDFFPYVNHPQGFRTGYFTSRAAVKRFDRHSNNIFQATRQLNAYAAINNHANLFFLNKALGIAQHHDVVSGTEKQYVADDYVMRLAYGIDKAFFALTSYNPTVHPRIHFARIPVTRYYTIRHATVILSELLAAVVLKIGETF